MKIGVLLINIYTKYKIWQKRNWAVNVEKDNLNSIKLQNLTKKEKEDLKMTWGKLNLSIRPPFFMVFKTVAGFNPLYLSDDLFFPLIIRCLNPSEYTYAFEHKGFYSFLYKDIPQPTNYIKRIRNVLYDEEMNVISEKKAIEILVSKTTFIIKPAKSSCMGKNIKKIHLPDENQIKNLLLEYKTDFVIQQYISQSQQTSAFNKDSLNTFRISSLYLNGKVSICSIIFRCGQGSSAVDNCGAGGLAVGVNEDGSFKEYALDNKYRKHYSTLNGTQFKNYRINEVANIVELVKNYHQRLFPHCGFIGWDICLDINDKPILIEVNLEFPGIQLEQLAIEKPIFGERTQEVISFVTKERIYQHF